jgi:hypothetical protein
LERQGCNAGKCHGNRTGKGGFSLSLFSASPANDYLEIARSSHGRYMNGADPDRSLLLLKASGQLNHEGGIRIVPRSWEYQVLREWIASGAGREPGRGDIKELQVIPHEHLFKAGESLQLKVIAQFADGGKEDVTCFCDFRNPDAETVTVSKAGQVVAKKPGDIGIRVFYRGRSRVMRALVAFPAAKTFVYPKVPEVNFIDRAVFAQLRRLNIVPSELCSDEHFLRRVHIDMLGALPAPTEVRAFLASKDPDKRTKKIDELLVDPRHAGMLALKFCESTDLIGGRIAANSPQAKAAQMAHDWFRKRIQENMPYDRIVASVLTATSGEGREIDIWRKEKLALAKCQTGFGSSYAERSTLDHFWRGAGLPRPPSEVFGPSTRRPQELTEAVDGVYLEEVAERTAAAFLGIQLECARCHVHPLDGWSTTDHRAFANVFAQVRLGEITVDKTLPQKDWTAEKDRAAVSREVLVGAPQHLRVDADSGAVLKPRLLGGPEIDFRGDARESLARWLARPDNRFFARHFVNRIWEHYMGVSLVESCDGVTPSHGPAHQTFLNVLAKDFIDSKFDIRRLERNILLSRAYQLSPIENETNKHDRTNFSHSLRRRPGKRVHIDMLLAVFDAEDKFGPGVPAGLRAVEVMHLGEIGAQVGSRDDYQDRINGMVHHFGRAELVSRCAEENDDYLLLGYGNVHFRQLFAGSKRVDRLIKMKPAVHEVTEELFLAFFGRLPIPKETERFNEYLERELRKNARHAYEDVFWLLINTKEFIMRQ